MPGPAPRSRPGGKHARRVREPSDSLPASDDDQQPSPVGDQRPACHDTVCGSGSPLGTRPGGGKARARRTHPELAMSDRLRSRETAAGRIDVSPVSVRNSRDFAVNPRHSATPPREAEVAHLQGHSAHAPSPTSCLPCRRSWVRIPSAASKERPAKRRSFCPLGRGLSGIHRSCSRMATSGLR